MPQFTKKPFARSVKVQVEHVYTPLTAAKNALQASTVDGVEQNQVPFFMHWNLTMLNSRAFEHASVYPNQQPYIYFPFVLPPFQQDFDAVTLRMPDTQPTLREISLSFDQRAEPLGISDPYSQGGGEGLLCASDMDRYTVKLQLIERTPFVFNNTDDEKYDVLLDLTIPGAEAFGNPFFRQNPILVDELYVPIHPYRSYAWRMQVEGLYDAAGVGPPGPAATVNQLSMPSLTLSAKFTHPLVPRDENAGGALVVDVQNLPVKHLGVHQTGTISLTIPASNSIIQGTSDLQTPFGTFDQILLNKLRAGYGSGGGASAVPGLEADTYPWEQLARDAGYQAIVVPLWQGYEDVRCRNVPTYGLPYISAPWQAPTGDRRLIRVPNGFVLHHAVAVWNTTSYPAANTGNTGPGVFPSAASLEYKVGIGLNNGLRGDDYRYQQVAYLEWTANAYNNFLIDQFSQNGTMINYTLLHIPLVAPVGTNDFDSYFLTGKPFFMTPGNSTTQLRVPVGQMPEAFGGGAYITPGTKGGESWLEVRWVMQDSTLGLDNPADLDAVLVGMGGHSVILLGRQVSVL